METGYLQKEEYNSILSLTIPEQNQFQVYETPSIKLKLLEEKVRSTVQDEGIGKDFLNRAGVIQK